MAKHNPSRRFWKRPRPDMSKVRGRVANSKPDWLPARSKYKGKLLVLYDGVCGLCDRTIQMLLEEDQTRVLMYAPLQGTTAAEVFKRHPPLKSKPDSLVLVRNFGEKDESVYVQSSGVLGIFNAIGGFWRVVSWLRIVPVFIRNAVYDWVARNRYKWFGKYKECRTPSLEARARFLP